MGMAMTNTAHSRRSAPGGREPAMKGALLVCGTHSDAGKSVVTAGICRWLARSGVRVAPFKAQNMSLNSVVTPGGSEIGRAQAVQAAAAGVEPEAAMNPILIKPSGERHSQVVVMGRPYADADARSYRELKDELRPVVAQALSDLRARFDVVVCEGAGSPAEINLRDGDLTNLGLAREHGLPALLVADIDRGGVFASLFGTLALLHPDDQAHVTGFVINKFRGEQSILAPGLAQLQERTGRATFGVLPWVEDLWMDVEDSQALQAPAPEAPAAAGGDTLDVAVLRLRWISNFTDLDALAAEPGVRVRFTRSAADVERADLLVLPGTKATVEDLERLRDSGLDRAIAARAAGGGPILGICGGYQLLGEGIRDEVESRRGEVAGLGLLPIRTSFAAEKLVRRRSGRCPWLDAEAGGYEIRHGRVERHDDDGHGRMERHDDDGHGRMERHDDDGHGGEPLFVSDDGEADGCRVGSVLGTSWHGALEHDAFRRALLAWVAAARGRRFTQGTASFAAMREARLDALGDLVGEHVDTERLAALIGDGVPSGLPTIETEVRACVTS
jgi:adenosylcobyric acid synthase